MSREKSVGHDDRPAPTCPGRPQDFTMRCIPSGRMSTMRLPMRLRSCIIPLRRKLACAAPGAFHSTYRSTSTPRLSFRQNRDLFLFFNSDFSPISLPGLEDFRRDLLMSLADSQVLHFGRGKIELVDWLSSSNKGSEAESWELLCEGASLM